MKKFKKSIAITVVLSLCILLAAPVDAKAKVKLNLTKATLSVGGSVNLKLLNNKKKVKWSSSNKKVVTVTNKGKVKAKKKGNAKIVAKVGKKKYICKVTVGKVSKVAQSTKKTSATTNPSPTPTEKFDFFLNCNNGNPIVFSGKMYLPVGISCIRSTAFHTLSTAPIVWEVSDESIISLRPTNHSWECDIIPHKVGECDVFATIGNITKSCHIVVI